MFAARHGQVAAHFRIVRTEREGAFVTGGRCRQPALTVVYQREVKNRSGTLRLDGECPQQRRTRFGEPVGVVEREPQAVPRQR